MAGAIGSVRPLRRCEAASPFGARALLTLFACLFEVAVPTVLNAGGREQASRRHAEFDVAIPNSLKALTASRLVLERARPETSTVSDLMLAVDGAGDDARRALAAADGERQRGSPGLFRARLYVVAGGRLYADAKGWCSAWRANESWCSVDCDGGGFMLRRTPAPGAGALELVIEGASGTQVDVLAPGLALTACRAGEDDEIRLHPAGALGEARIPFVAR